jgi:uncharacterized protein with HEPN domain
MKRDPDTLADILFAARMIESFVGGLDEAAFLQDSKTQYAVYAQIIIMGEAARRLSDEFRQQHATLPWQEMIGMRNRIVHGYDEIDWQIVWHTTQSNIPDLISKITAIVPQAE